MSRRPRFSSLRLAGTGLVVPADERLALAEGLKMAAGGLRRPRIVRTRPKSQDALLRQSEAAWRATVCEYAALRGWHWWSDRATNAPRHCHQCGAVTNGPRNPAGHPDLVLIRRPVLIWAELKADDGVVSPAQEEFLDDLYACGQQVYIWTPREWPDVESLLR